MKTEDIRYVSGNLSSEAFDHHNDVRDAIMSRRLPNVGMEDLQSESISHVVKDNVSKRDFKLPKLADSSNLMKEMYGESEF